MNWGRLIVAGIVGGICLDVANVVMHGFIMSNAYMKYPVFSVDDPASPLMFTLIDVMIGLAAALLLALTRKCWASGVSGGALFGMMIGLVGFWPPFYNSLVIAGFPYHLSWCWGGITVIGYVIMGAVQGLIYRKTAA